MAAEKAHDGVIIAALPKRCEEASALGRDRSSAMSCRCDRGRSARVRRDRTPWSKPSFQSAPRRGRRSPSLDSCPKRLRAAPGKCRRASRRADRLACDSMDDATPLGGFVAPIASAGCDQPGSHVAGDTVLAVHRSSSRFHSYRRTARSSTRRWPLDRSRGRRHARAHMPCFPPPRDSRDAVR